MSIDFLPSILRIDSELTNADQSQISLYGGSVGVAIFYAHFYLATLDEKHLEKVEELINDVMQKLPSSEINYTLAGGVTGVAWGIQYLMKKSFFSMDANELFEDVDDYIYQSSLADLQRGSLDLLHGGSGPILYALERLPNDNALAYIKSAVNLLMNVKTIEKHGSSWRWWTIDGELQSNFGLSHGNPAIVLLLLKIYQKSIMVPEIRELVNSTLEWMIGCRNNPNSLSLYPTNFTHKPAYQEYRYSRLAWCYGDLTIALMFWKAGEILKEERWKNEGLTIMSHSLQRVDPLEDQYLDAGICHGTSGIAHIFKIFARITGDPKYIERSHFWLTETLNLAKFNDTISGYKRSLKGNWLPSTQLLEGSAGIGLVMLGFMNDDTDWDECLLLS